MVRFKTLPEDWRFGAGGRGQALAPKGRLLPIPAGDRIPERQSYLSEKHTSPNCDNRFMGAYNDVSCARPKRTAKIV